MRSSGVKIMWR